MVSEGPLTWDWEEYEYTAAEHKCRVCPLSLPLCFSTLRVSLLSNIHWVRGGPPVGV